MGLSKSTSRKAFKLLKKINPKCENTFLQEYTRSEFQAKVKRPNIVMGFGFSIGCTENVFTDIENITDRQKANFRKAAVKFPNSHFIDEPDKDRITRLGFF